MFGKSSDETEWVSTVGVGGYNRKITPPAPAEWCKFVAERADVAGMLALDLKDELGSEGKRLAMVGLAEAVERCATTGTFDWLRIMPLLDDNFVEAEVSCRDKKAFLAAVTNVADLAAVQLSEGIRFFGLAADLEGDAAAAQREVAFQHDRLGLKWLRVLVHHAPDMSSMHEVLLNPVIAAHTNQLDGAICSTVRKYSFPTKAEAAVGETVI